MNLTPGNRLGIYEIVGFIGAGGLGEVYRVRDTKLDRHVAIKVLPHVFADDPERPPRFEREARTLASLNHPNIAQIYGVEETPEHFAIVMELVVARISRNASRAAFSRGPRRGRSRASSRKRSTPPTSAGSFTAT